MDITCTLLEFGDSQFNLGEHALQEVKKAKPYKKLRQLKNVFSNLADCILNSNGSTSHFLNLSTIITIVVFKYVELDTLHLQYWPIFRHNLDFSTQ